MKNTLEAPPGWTLSAGEDLYIFGSVMENLLTKKCQNKNQIRHNFLHRRGNGGQNEEYFIVNFPAKIGKLLRKTEEKPPQNQKKHTKKQKNTFAPPLEPTHQDRQRTTEMSAHVPNDEMISF